jgi:hypothetical protein
VVGIILPNSLETIGDDTFAQWSGLRSVSLPSGLKTIGTTAFQECTNLSSITIPASVESIGIYAFFYAGLTSITFDGNDTSVGAIDLFGPSGTFNTTYNNQSNKAGTYTLSGNTWSKQ